MSTNGMTFQKAARRRKRMKLGVTGPSGAGKTLAALALARALAGPEGRLAVIDSENGSASLYGDRYEFDVLEIRPPYLTSKYREAIQAAIEAGYDALVIDSITHQWNGDGGILQRKEEADSVPGTNHWTNWKPFTKEHNEFRSEILNAPIHIVCTMRSKQAYAQTENGTKKRVEKLGLQPEQRDGMEYELDLVFDVAMDHRADTSKDRTSQFVGKRWNLCDPKTAKVLLDWLDSGAEPLPLPPESVGAVGNGSSAGSPRSATGASTDSAATNGSTGGTTSRPPRGPSRADLIAQGRMPIGTHNKGKLIGEVDEKDLASARDWAATNGVADVVDFLNAELERRREERERNQGKLFGGDGEPKNPAEAIRDQIDAMAGGDR